MSSALSLFLQALILVPAAVMTYAPIMDQTSSFWRQFLRFLSFSAGTSILIGLLSALLHINVNILIFFGALILIFHYMKISHLDIIRALSICFWSIATMSYLYSFGFMGDAIFHPDGSYLYMSVTAAALRLAAGGLIAWIYFIIISRSRPRLIHSEYLTDSHWFITLPVSFIFFFLNYLMIPRSYSLIHNPTVLRIYLSYMIFSFSLYVLMFIIFRMFSLEFIENARAREEQHFLAVQESEYLNLQQNIEQIRRFRHDMRHSFALLNELAEKNDIEGIRKYLAEYQELSPEMKVQSFCRNGPVNAVLNHYNAMAMQDGITPVLQINIPEHLSIPDPSLCSMIGNLFENAIEGCLTIPTDKRRISLTAMVKDGGNLFLVTTNTFDGNVKMMNGHYLSTKRKNGGIGTISIATIAEKYGGTSSFHHTDTEFFVDIMIPVTVGDTAQ